eukprot:c8897_g1_i1.p1 GENE.c8897_g1_i1~~c8897_g1_i1.p1  ORF type:complete len:1390 (-),score=268.74 c8897_g1_i1:134-4264(-)
MAGLTPRSSFALEIQKNFEELDNEIGELREVIKRHELRADMKKEQLDQLRALLLVHEKMQQLVAERLAHAELQHQTTTNNLDYKSTLLQTFKEGLEVKSRTLATLEQAVYEQTRRVEILTTRKSVSQYCLDARNRQIKLLSEHVAGTLEERARQKEGLANFHAERLREQEHSYKLQAHLAKTNQKILRERFDSWKLWTERSKHAKRMMRGTFMVWKMRQLKEVQRECLLAWREYVRQKKLARERLVKMAHSHDFTVGYLFLKWREFVHHKNEIADKHFQHHITLKVFRNWRTETAKATSWRHQRLHDFQAKKNEKLVALLGHIFSEWRSYTAKTRVNRKSLAATGSLLVGRVFRSWRGLLKVTHDKQNREQEQRLAKLGFLFTKWREFARKRRLMRRAVITMTHFTEVKAFRAIRDNVHQQQLAKRAIGHMQNPLLAKALSKWRSQIATDKAIRQRFFTLNQLLLKATFDHLRRNAQLNRNMRGAVVRMKHPELSKAFNAWKEALQDRKKWQAVAQAFDKVLVSRCFDALRSAAKQSASLHLFAKRRAPVFTLRHYYENWVNFVHENKVRRKVIFRMKTAPLQPFFDQWRKKVHLIKLCRQFLSRLDNNVEKIVFDQWRQFVVLRKEERRQREKAFLLPLRRAYDSWHRVTFIAEFCASSLIIPTEDSVLSRPLAIAAKMPPELWDNITNFEKDLIRTVRVSSYVGSLSPRHGHKCLAIDNGGIPDANLKGSVFVFGGRDATGFLGDLVVVDMYGLATSVVRETPGSTPKPRAFHSFERNDNNLVMFGGFCDAEPERGFSKPQILSDMWFFSLSTFLWKPVTYANKFSEQELEAESNRLARCCHSSCVYGGSLWIFGGLDSTLKCTNKMMRFNFLRSEWIDVACHGDVPSPRSDMGCTVMNSSMFIIGGSNERTLLSTTTVLFDDFYEFQFMRHQWIKITAPGKPPARQSPFITLYNNSLYVLGGSAEESDHLVSTDNKVYSFSLSANSWSSLEAPTAFPMRQDASMCRLGKFSVVLVGGSSDISANLNDMWRIDLECDTLRILRVGAMKRLEDLAPNDPQKTIICLVHLLRNPHNRPVLMKHPKLLDLILDHCLDPQSAFHDLCFRALSSLCERVTSISGSTTATTAFLSNMRASNNKILMERTLTKDLLSLSVQLFQFGPLPIRAPAAMLWLWVASDPNRLAPVLATGVGVTHIGEIALGISKAGWGVPRRARQRALDTLEDLGLAAVKNENDEVQVIATSTKGVATIANIFRKAKTAALLEAELAVQTLVVLSCDEKNREFLTRYFGSEGSPILTSMVDCSNPLIQRAACTLARWLVYRSPDVAKSLSQAGIDASLVRLIDGSELDLSANAFMLRKYIQSSLLAVSETNKQSE